MHEKKNIKYLWEDEGDEELRFYSDLRWLSGCSQGSPNDRKLYKAFNKYESWNIGALTF